MSNTITEFHNATPQETFLDLPCSDCISRIYIQLMIEEIYEIQSKNRQTAEI